MTANWQRAQHRCQSSFLQSDILGVICARVCQCHIGKKGQTIAMNKSERAMAQLSEGKKGLRCLAPQWSLIHCDIDTAAHCGHVVDTFSAVSVCSVLLLERAITTTTIILLLPRWHVCLFRWRRTTTTPVKLVTRRARPWPAVGWQWKHCKAPGDMTSASWPADLRHLRTKRLSIARCRVCRR